jgi:hypothetical protein
VTGPSGKNSASGIVEPRHGTGIACLPPKQRNPTFPISGRVLKFFLMFILTRPIVSINFYECKVQQDCFGLMGLRETGPTLRGRSVLDPGEGNVAQVFLVNLRF